MSIKRRNLHESLENWIMAESGLGPGIGDVHYLCSSATGAPYLWLKQRGVDSDHLHITWAAAYAALTAGRNDALFVMPGANVTTSALTWAKDYTHLIGATAPNLTNHRARIYTTGTAVSPLMTWSGNGCVCKNVMFDHQGSNATTAGVVFNLSGARNHFDRVTMRHIGALAVASDTHRVLQIASSDGENYFEKCTFGADTVDAGTGAGIIIEFNGTNETARNVFDGCLVLANGSINQTFITASTTSSTSSFQLFKECLFYNNDNGDLDPLTQAFNISVNCGGQFLLMDCLVYGAATYQTSNSANLLGRHSYAAATTDLAVSLTY